MLISHQGNRFKGKSIETWKKEFAAEMGIKYWGEYDLDHKIPFCICADSSKENLQLIHFKEHAQKTRLDFKIIKKLREEKLIEKVTHYCMELMVPKEIVIARYKELLTHWNN